MPTTQAQPSHTSSASLASTTGPSPLILVAAMLAAALPTQLAFHLAPSATLLNQCLAVAAWGLWLMVLAPRLAWRQSWPLTAPLLLLALAALGSQLLGDLPLSLALTALALLASAAVMVAAGAAQARGAMAVPVFGAFCVGLLLAGLVGGAVALVQVFLPGWADGQLIARSAALGRAVGNLRQPNHLCTLLLWAMVALVALNELGWPQRAAARLGPKPWLVPVLSWAALAWLVLAVELSASRTGAVGLLLLLLWGLVDKRLSASSRRLLCAAPLLYGLAYGAMALLGELSAMSLGAGARLSSDGLGEAASANSRLNIWRNTWALALAHAWTGVGFGEFNIAWTLTGFHQRPTAFFDHSHNLPLQFAAELGLPLAGLVLGLLVWALWSGARRALAAPGQHGVAGRAALVLVLLVGLHSMVEYPLWYAYFLLPAAWAWGWLLGLPAPSTTNTSAAPGAQAQRVSARGWSAGALAGLLMLAGGGLAMADYHRVAVIYAPPPGAGSLHKRISQGQRSVLFAHHADYAAATNAMPAEAAALGLSRTTHALLDTRLMVAWARRLHEQGQIDLARTVAQRLREFNHPEAKAFFSACTQPDSAEFQCQPPLAEHGWREFVAATRPR